MDPVNPAPAGNPQLTTHLLVSHKKNKNFHPSKVSLKRVNFVTKTVPLPTGIVPVADMFFQIVDKVWTRNNKQWKLTDISMDEDRIRWSSRIDEYNLQQPLTIDLKILYQVSILTGSNSEEGITHIFNNLTFVLKVMDWDDSELLHLTEKDVGINKFSHSFQKFVRRSSWTSIYEANSLELKFGWNYMHVKIGDQPLHALNCDQPLDDSSESGAFFAKHSTYLFSWGSDKTCGEILQPLAEGDVWADCFQDLNRCSRQVSQYIEYLSKQAQAASQFSPKLKSLIQQMVQKLVYWTQPFVKSIVEPVLQDLKSFKSSELAVKMGDIFERLVTHQTLDSLESLKDLASCLYCDWNEMLRLLVLNNWEFYEKHVQNFVASTDAEMIELRSRLCNQRGYPILRLTAKILDSVKFKQKDPPILSEPADLEERSAKLTKLHFKGLSNNYMCFSSSDSYFICHSPNRLEENICDHTEPLRRINLGLSTAEVPARILFSHSTLMFVLEDGSVILCDLPTVMKGPPEQTLTEAGRTFVLSDGYDITDSSVKLVLGDNNLVCLQDFDGTTYAIWFHFKKEPKRTPGEIFRFSEAEPTTLGDGLPDVSNFCCKFFPNNMLVMGVVFTATKTEDEGTKPACINFMVLQYNRETNQVKLVCDEFFDIDDVFLSQLPCWATRNTGIYLNFGMCKDRIFCVAEINQKKFALQVFCYYRNKFHLIGGTNCGRAGIYVMERNTYVHRHICSIFSNDPPELKELHLWKGKVEYDLKQRLATVKFCELAPRF